MTGHVRLLLLLFAAMLVNFGAIAEATPTFPQLTGRVVDEADVLSTETEEALTARLAALESATSRQVVVVTLASLQGLEIEDYGYQLGRTWGIGEARKNTGVLLIVAPGERMVRIEVGYGLEPVLTDALAHQILQEAVLPLFREGRISEGIVAGADAIVRQLSASPEEAKAKVESASRNADDPLPVVFGVLIGAWLLFGLLGALRGRGVAGWLWPLLFLARRSSGGKGDVFRGRGGSFGGGGASGRW